MKNELSTSGLIRKSLREASRNNVDSMSAALSFYAIFSLGPIMLVLFYTFGRLIEAERLEQMLTDLIGGYVNVDITTLLEELVSAYEVSSSNIILSALGILVIIIVASKAFSQLQRAMNRIWEADEESPGFWIWLLRRALGLVIVIIIGLVLSGFLVAETFFPWVQGFWSNLAAFLAGLIFLVLFFKFLPSKKIAWKHIWLGALLTAVFFSLGQLALALFLRWSSVGSVYGLAGTLLLVLLWIYYSARVFLTGAQFTKVHYNLQSK